MEIQLKQRLVGLTVIFSLAVIFLPMLLDGSGLAPKPVEINIPPAPNIDTNVRVEEKIIELKKEAADLKTLAPVIVDEISDPPDTAQKEAQAADVQKPVEEKESSAGVNPVQQTEMPRATAVSGEKVAKVAAPQIKTKEVSKPQVGGELWVIQTGSFREKNLAYKQRDRIRQSKLSAVFIEKFDNNSKLSYRVRMGPFITRKKAEIVRNKVMAKYSVKGIVMKYEK